MEQLRAVIFDVDGTLAETERDGHRVSFNRAFREVGLDWEWSVSLYGELLEVSGGKERIGFYLRRYQPDFCPPKDLNQFIADLHLLKTQYYRELLSEGAIPLRPGVKRLLEELRNLGVRLAIATTSALPNVLGLLEHHLDPSWFELIAAGDIVPAKKPAPDIYNYVLEKMGLEPRECVVIEDSSQGLEASTKAGLKTIVTVNEYTKGQDFTKACLVLNHLGEPEQPFTVIRGDGVNGSYVDPHFLDGKLDLWAVVRE